MLLALISGLAIRNFRIFGPSVFLGLCTSLLPGGLIAAVPWIPSPFSLVDVVSGVLPSAASWFPACLIGFISS